MQVLLIGFFISNENWGLNSISLLKWITLNIEFHNQQYAKSMSRSDIKNGKLSAVCFLSDMLTNDLNSSSLLMSGVYNEI